MCAGTYVDYIIQKKYMFVGIIIINVPTIIQVYKYDMIDMCIGDMSFARLHRKHFKRFCKKENQLYGLIDYTKNEIFWQK